MFSPRAAVGCVELRARAACVACREWAERVERVERVERTYGFRFRHD
ncbi:MAG: hypothetical protein QM756_38445 [Polyangiaceae bacterium]